MTFELIDHLEANHHLEKLLVDDRIAGFATGDAWTIRFVETDYRLAFHGMQSSKEAEINQTLKLSNHELFEYCADPDEISWAVILASVIRRRIVAAITDSEGAITLGFEGDVEIKITTDTNIVDWQWCIAEGEHPNPYSTNYRLACLWKSEISRSS